MSSAARDEARRIMQICNACRYCEGLCAVFPAMVKRRSFTDQDLDYLANLCHHCQACYYGCQYAPPHEFELNVPRAFSSLRARTWSDYAWPKGIGETLLKKSSWIFLALAALFSLLLLLAGLNEHGKAFFQNSPSGDFYRLMPHGMLVWIAGPVFGFALLAVFLSIRQYWQRTQSPQLGWGAFGGAVKDILSLRHLGGGDAGGSKGCNIDSERFSMARRYFHHATFYGFLLCFFATVVGTLYHYLLGWAAPYAYTSLPVISGTTGGLLLCVGVAGLYWLKSRADTAVASQETLSMDRTFMLLLFATSLSGLLLLAFRETSLLGILLVVHLGIVLAFFISLPYSKMVHGAYRAAALIRYHIESKQP